MKLTFTKSILLMATLYAQPLRAQQADLYVSADQLSVRSCASTSCGRISWLLSGQKVTVVETRNGWARISKYYDAACKAGKSEYVDSGNSACSEENGISNGQLAEWVSLDYLKANPEKPKPASSSILVNALRKSDNFNKYEAEFTRATQQLIDDGECTEADVVENAGWAKATGANADLPVFFMYCKGFTAANRLYLDASTGRTFR
ncbi:MULTISPECIES: SH3 domain-containing protein [unclassified Sulfitobacter]|uniref:SH3 domain-containing protein n=1 Tax=unclassified Sulfitobacter TaxID=196795 RepID=UPI003744D0A5